MARKRKPRSPEPHDYYLEIMSWHSSCSNLRNAKVRDGELLEEERSHDIEVLASVRLLNPIQEVFDGSIRISSSRKHEWHPTWQDSEVHDTGGYITYRKAGPRRVLDGVAWASMEAILQLTTLLLGGQRVILSLRGDAFYRGKALIRGTEWFTHGHPDYSEDLAYEVERNPPPESVSPA